MNIKNAALKTELMLARISGFVEDKGEYLVIRTPENPSYWYGHVLVFPRAPRPGSLLEWNSLFQSEFPEEFFSHRVFYWDGPEHSEDGIREFLDAGYVFSELDVLICNAPCEISSYALPLAEFSREMCASNEDWQGLATFTRETETADKKEHVFSESYDNFLQKKILQRQLACQNGQGEWWTVRYQGRMVASMGLLWDGGIARFQDVQTHPEFRGRGLCSALLKFVMERAFSVLNLKTLVIVPADDRVSKIYQRVGFEFLEKTKDLFLAPNALA